MKCVIIFILSLGGLYFFSTNKSLAPDPGSNISKTQSTNTCRNISTKQAVEIVKKQPEVYDFMNQAVKPTEDQKSTPMIRVDRVSDNTIEIHVFTLEDYTDEIIPSHTTTFNWYTIDRCNGEIKCSFYIYKEGKFLRASETNEHPCK